MHLLTQLSKSEPNIERKLPWNVVLGKMGFTRRTQNIVLDVIKYLMLHVKYVNTENISVYEYRRTCRTLLA